jgi:predicted DNA binding CopG/RHH family protein
MTKRALVHSVEEIPQFASEQEEREWWDHHDFGDEFLDGARPVSEVGLPGVYGPRSRAINIRIDDSMLNRLRALAERREVPYQTLLKQFVAERLYEEEKREGIIG